MTMWQHFQAGGWAMWLILVWLVAAAVVFVHRSFYFFGAHQEAAVFTAAVTKLVEIGDWDRAIKLSSAAKTPLGRITAEGLAKAHLGPRAFQSGVDEAALRELPAIRRYIDFMAFFANLAMLSGLFGTIVGLIKSFGSVGGEGIDLEAKSRVLAEGIGEAMNCTAFGLLTAMLALVGFALLSWWATAIEEALDLETVKILNAVVRRTGGF
jgi:biopolymer transport protein ExbB/TolQ